MRVGLLSAFLVMLMLLIGLCSVYAIKGINEDAKEILAIRERAEAIHMKYICTTCNNETESIGQEGCNECDNNTIQTKY